MTLNKVNGFEIGVADEVGLAPAGVDKLGADMRGLVDSGRRAGVISAVACRGRLVHFQCAGLRDLEKDLPMEPDTLFRLYSMTRAVTAVGLLTLVDDGRLRLDDPVAEYLPEFKDTPVIRKIDGDEVITEPQSRPMTLHHLLTYTAGFGYPESYPASLGLTMDRVLPIGGTLEHGIRTLATFPLIDQPGAHWYYGFCGDVTARVAEVASGQSYDEFLDSRVFEPLGMTSTGFTVDPEHSDRLAQMYSHGPEDTFVNTTARAPAINSYKKGETLFSGGGGLISTAGDYLKFGQMLLNGGEFDGARLLKPETVAIMLQNHLAPEQGPLLWSAKGRGTPEDIWSAHDGYGWGLGISVRLEGTRPELPGTRGECRWDGLANTTYFIDPRNEIVAVAMAQYLALDQRELELVLRNNLYNHAS